MRFTRLFAVLACAILASTASAQRQKLDVGGQAPGLDIETWVNGDAVTIENDKVYVVVFFSTTSARSRRAVPLLTQWQEDYRDDDLTVFAVTVERENAVREFARQQGSKLGFPIGIDRRQSTERAWMRAAELGDEVLPLAFAIDQKGRIAFFGHPSHDEFEPLLKRVLSGRYDPELEERAKPTLKVARQNRNVRNWRVATMHYDQVIDLDPKIFAEIALERFDMMIKDMDARGDAYNYARHELIAGKFKADPGALLMLADRIMSDPELDDEDRDLDVAMEAAEAMRNLEGQNDPEAMALVASVHARRGNITEAIQLQKRAYFRVSTKHKDRFKEVLNSYQRRAAERE